MRAQAIAWLVQVGQALGWTLLHSLWIGALIGAIFALLRAAISNQHIAHENADAAAAFSQRHRIWRAQHALGVAALLCIALASAGMFFKVYSPAQPPSLSAAQTDAQQASTIVLDAPKPTASLRSNTASNQWVAHGPMLIASVWLLGVGVCAWRLARSHRTLCTLTRLSSPPTGGMVWINTLLESMRMHDRVTVLVSEWIDVPCVIGLIKPVILLPIGLITRLPPEQLELILLHELSHVKNGDLWINCGQIALETLLFFHPVVHWISADVRAARELRCDQSVLALRAKPKLYAQTLLSLEEFRQDFQNLALAANGSAMAPLGELHQRVREILAVGRPASSVKSNTASAVPGKPNPRLVVLRTQMQGAMTLSALSIALLAAGLAQFQVPAIPPATQARPFASLVATVPSKLAAPATLVRREVQAASKASAIQRGTGARKSAPDALRRAISGNVEITRPLTLARLRIAQTRATAPELQIDSSGLDVTELRLEALRMPAIASAKSVLSNALQTAPAPARLPKLLLRVLPEFVAGPRGRGTFRMRFSLDANGQPQNIELSSGRPTKSQLAAVSDALVQWRFATTSVPFALDQRFEQSFAFGRTNSKRCIPPLGSRICGY